MDSKLIQKLKDNSEPFWLMSRDMQAELLVLYRKNTVNVQHASRTGVWDDKLPADPDDNIHLTYRLRADYQAGVDFRECELVHGLVNEDYQTLKYRDDDKQLRSLSLIPDGFKVAGFKFEGIKTIINKEFGYSHNGVDLLPFVEYDQLKSGKFTVHFATHVLFRKA